MKKLESGEMYLESIFVLKNSIKKVHATDVANFLQYSKPSVSRALGILRDSNLIVVGKDGAIDFTDEGLQYANSIYEKHFVSCPARSCVAAKELPKGVLCEIEAIAYLEEE